jgi:hypothetical protein
VNEAAPLQAILDRVQRRALLVGALALLVLIIGGLARPTQFFQAYLMAYLLWLGIALGSQAILMIHHLAGGRWGFSVRRLLEAATRTLPLLAVLFVPVLFGVRWLYPWARPEVVEGDELLQHKQAYLNVAFFVIRAVFYFVVWLGTARALDRAAAVQDQTPSPAATRLLTIVSALGVVLYAFTMTFASIDWAMSLEPRWFSTIYGVLFMTGHVLSGFAFVIVVAALLSRYEPYARTIEPAQFQDLGNFLLTFIVFWAYIAYSQFLIIWAGNLTDENPWYLRRTVHGWGVIAVLLICLHFFAPFLLLLSRDVKRRPVALAKVALIVLVMCAVDILWIVAPAFPRVEFAVSWMDLAAFGGIGGLWLWQFVRQLKGRSAVPAHDSRVEEELEWA